MSAQHGFIVLVFDHEYVLLQNEFNSDMQHLGCSLARQFDKLFNEDEHSLRSLKNLFDNVEIIKNGNSYPSIAQRNKLIKYAADKDQQKKLPKWKSLLKKCEGSIENILKSGHMLAEFVCYNRSSLNDYFAEGFAHNEIEETPHIYELNLDTNTFEYGAFRCKLTEVNEPKIWDWLEKSSESSDSDSKPKRKKGRKVSTSESEEIRNKKSKKKSIKSSSSSSSDSEDAANKKDSSSSDSAEFKPNKKPLKKVSKTKDSNSESASNSSESSEPEEKTSISDRNEYKLFLMKRISELKKTRPEQTPRDRMRTIFAEWKQKNKEIPTKTPANKPTQSNESGSSSESEEKDTKLMVEKKIAPPVKNDYQLWVQKRDLELQRYDPKMGPKERMRIIDSEWEYEQRHKSEKNGPVSESDEEDTKSDAPKSEYALFMEKRRPELQKMYPKADSHFIIMTAANEWKQKRSTTASVKPSLTPEQKKHSQRVERLNRSKAFIAYNTFIESKLGELSLSKPECSPVELYALASVAWRNSI